MQKGEGGAKLHGKGIADLVLVLVEAEENPFEPQDIASQQTPKNIFLSQPQPSQIPAEAKSGLGLNSVMRQNPPHHHHHPTTPPKLYKSYISAISQRIELKFGMMTPQVDRMKYRVQILTLQHCSIPCSAAESLNSVQPISQPFLNGLS